MKRKEFLKKSILGIAATTAIPATSKAEVPNKSTSTYDKLIDQVGFNH